jgi:putative intracellular protease/amidase
MTDVPGATGARGERRREQPRRPRPVPALQLTCLRPGEHRTFATRRSRAKGNRSGRAAVQSVTLCISCSRCSEGCGQDSASPRAQADGPDAPGGSADPWLVRQRAFSASGASRVHVLEAPLLIAIPLFDGITALDAVGPYEILSRLPGASVAFVATTPGIKRTDRGSLGLLADRALDDVPHCDVVLVPGGPGHDAAAQDERLLSWLVAVDATTSFTTSVCIGSLVLGAAGLLRGRRATTHWLSVDRLSQHAAVHEDSRVVHDGKYVTSAGVCRHRHGSHAGRSSRGRPSGAGDSAERRVRPAASFRGGQSVDRAR